MRLRSSARSGDGYCNYDHRSGKRDRERREDISRYFARSSNGLHARQTRTVNRVNNSDSFPRRSRPEADESGAFKGIGFSSLEIRILDREITLVVGLPDKCYPQYN